jgi:hypothetical protein
VIELIIKYRGPGKPLTERYELPPDADVDHYLTAFEAFLIQRGFDVPLGSLAVTPFGMDEEE